VVCDFNCAAAEKTNYGLLDAHTETGESSPKPPDRVDCALGRSRRGVRTDRARSVVRFSGAGQHGHAERFAELRRRQRSGGLTVDIHLLGRPGRNRQRAGGTGGGVGRQEHFLLWRPRRLSVPDLGNEYQPHSEWRGCHHNPRCVRRGFRHRGPSTRYCRRRIRGRLQCPRHGHRRRADYPFIRQHAK